MTLHDDLKCLWDALPKEAREVFPIDYDHNGFHATMQDDRRRPTETVYLLDKTASALLCYAAVEWLTEDYGATITHCLDGVYVSVHAHGKVYYDGGHDTLPAALAAAVEAVTVEEKE